jgi:tight adherence protein B
MRRRLAAAVALATLLGTALLGAAPVARAQSRVQVVIREVDTTKIPNVRVSALVTGGKPTARDFSLRENGQLVDDFQVVPISETQTRVGIVLAIDTSGSMARNNAINQAKAAARQFVASRNPNQEIALVEFGGGGARVLVQFTADAGALNAAIDNLAPGGETPLWDAVVKAAAIYDERGDLEPDVVLLSDGKDTVSTFTETDARSATASRNVTVFAVGLVGGDFEEGPVRSLAESTEGQYLVAPDPAALGGLYNLIQSTLQNQFEISYRSQASGVVNIDLTVSGVQTSAAVNVGAVTRGEATRPEFVDPGSTPSFLRSSTGKGLVVLLVLVAAVFIGIGLAGLMVRDRRTLESVLSPYDERVVINAAAEEGGRGGGMVMAETAIVKRAVEATARIAEQRGILVRLERALEQADLPLRAPEALFFYLAAVVLAGVLGVGLTGGLFGGLILTILVGLTPMAVVNVMAGLRRRKFTGQLPDMLQLLAGSLRAGYSVMQGLDVVAQEVDDPMGRELRRVQAEARLGRPLDDALEDAATRMGSEDFAWAVMAIKIQREVGGNLADLLSTVADTMLARERLRRDVRALTAEGRISAILLGVMPIALGFIIYALNPEYMRPLFEEARGQVMLIGSFLLAGFGFWWMKKIIDVEI